MAIYFPSKYPLKSWKVTSQNSFDKETGELLIYSVGLWGDNTLTCDCMWSLMNKRQPCKHRIDKTMELEEEFGSIEKAVDFYREQKKNNDKKN